MQFMIRKLCNGVPLLLAFVDEFLANRTVFRELDDRKLALGWFIREWGLQWEYI